jgi:hypothetical protein
VARLGKFERAAFAHCICTQPGHGVPWHGLTELDSRVDFLESTRLVDRIVTPVIQGCIGRTTSCYLLPKVFRVSAISQSAALMFGDLV